MNIEQEVLHNVLLTLKVIFKKMLKPPKQSFGTLVTGIYD